MQVTRVNPKYLPLDTTLGDLHARNNLTENANPPYFVTMESFAAGGILHWTSLSSAKAVLLAGHTHAANTLTGRFGTITLANGTQIWDNSNGNTHMLTPEIGTAQAEYSFEGAGFYKRTRTRSSTSASWNGWSGWSKIA